MGRDYDRRDLERKRTTGRKHGPARNRRNGPSTGNVGAPRFTSVRPVARTRLTSGAVVWAHVPFCDADEEKTRPAVVVDADRHQVLVLPVSGSFSRFRYPTIHVEITDLEAAGLSRPCGLRLRPVVLDRIEVLTSCGQLGEEDLASMLVAVRQLGIGLGEVAGAH